ncbi:methyltransferase domain-containing protein, partial [Laribacter hongkongensis]
MTEAFYTDKSRVRASFDRAAATYDRAAVLQREVCDRMATRLDLIRHAPAQVLDAGSGTGYGAGLLRARYPEAQVTELDLAPSMLRASRDKQLPQGRLRRLFARAPALVCADLEQLPLA